MYYDLFFHLPTTGSKYEMKCFVKMQFNIALSSRETEFTRQQQLVESEDIYPTYYVSRGK